MDEFQVANAADGLKPTTLAWYRVRLSKFVSHVGGEILIQEISTAMIREWIIVLRGREKLSVGHGSGQVKMHTLHGYMRALRRFWRWSCLEYDITPNPMDRVRLPQRPRPEPKAISLDDLRAIFIACDESPEGLRDRALIAFLCDTGCRAGGALGLTVEDCDLAHLRARVVEKGDRPRVVPFSTFTAYHLIKWFEVRPKGTAVFCSLKKRRGLPLSYSGLAKILSRLKEKAGVKGRVNPHSFRHGFAREYVRNGGDLSSLSRLLGHSGIGVTADYYAVFSEPEIAEFHAKYSPIRNLINEHNRPDSP